MASKSTFVLDHMRVPDSLFFFLNNSPHFLQNSLTTPRKLCLIDSPSPHLRMLQTNPTKLSIFLNCVPTNNRSFATPILYLSSISAIPVVRTRNEQTSLWYIRHTVASPVSPPPNWFSSHFSCTWIPIKYQHQLSARLPPTQSWTTGSQNFIMIEGHLLLLKLLSKRWILQASQKTLPWVLVRKRPS